MTEPTIITAIEGSLKTPRWIIRSCEVEAQDVGCQAELGVETLARFWVGKQRGREGRDSRSNDVDDGADSTDVSIDAVTDAASSPKNVVPAKKARAETAPADSDVVVIDDENDDHHDGENGEEEREENWEEDAGEEEKKTSSSMNGDEPESEAEEEGPDYEVVGGDGGESKNEFEEIEILSSDDDDDEKLDTADATVGDLTDEGNAGTVAPVAPLTDLQINPAVSSQAPSSTGHSEGVSTDRYSCTAVAEREGNIVVEKRAKRSETEMLEAKMKRSEVKKKRKMMLSGMNEIQYGLWLEQERRKHQEGRQKKLVKLAEKRADEKPDTKKKQLTKKSPSRQRFEQKQQNLKRKQQQQKGAGSKRKMDDRKREEQERKTERRREAGEGTESRSSSRGHHSPSFSRRHRPSSPVKNKRDLATLQALSQSHPASISNASVRDFAALFEQLAAVEGQLTYRVDKFYLSFENPGDYGDAVERIVAALSSMKSPNVFVIACSLFAPIPPQQSTIRTKLIQFFWLSDHLKRPVIQLCLSLNYWDFDALKSGAILVDALARGLISEVRQFIDCTGEANVESALRFVSSLLGSSFVAEAVRYTFEMKEKKDDDAVGRLKDLDLLNLIEEICVRKGLAYPQRCMKYRLYSVATMVVGSYRRDEIEPDEIIRYFEDYVKDGGSELVVSLLEELAPSFAALAQFLDAKWMIASLRTRKMIEDNLPRSLPLVAKNCNDNVALHSLLGSVGTSFIRDAISWQLAVFKLRESGVISIAVSKLLDPKRPRTKLGAIAFCVKSGGTTEGERLFVVQLASIDDKLRRTVFEDLKDLLHPSNKKWIVTFSDAIFDADELAFLRDQLEERCILDVGESMYKGSHMPCRTLSEICSAVTGGPMCNRTSYTSWCESVEQLACQHLGIRCIVVLDYVFKGNYLAKPETSDLMKSQVADWQRKYN